MIARQAVVAVPQRTAERARTASRRRARRTRRARYTGAARLCAVFGALLGAVLLYVALTASVTSLNYALARAEYQKTQLQEESMRLDDRIAHLGSRERLAALAARLNMHDPHVYAVVRLPEPKPQSAPHGLAFLGAVSDWFRTP